MKTKNFVYLFALLSLISCNKDSEIQNETFKEGQTVYLTVGTPSVNDNAYGINARRIEGYCTGDHDDKGDIIDGTLTGIAFCWQEGDTLNVSAIDSKTGKRVSSTFHIVEWPSKGDTSGEIHLGGNAIFRGVMPTDGSKFDLAYGPATVPTVQYYHYDGISRNTMRMEAKDCDINSTITLAPVWSAFRTSVKINKNYSTHDATYWESQNLTYHMTNMGVVEFTATMNPGGVKSYQYVLPADKDYASGADIVLVLEPGNYSQLTAHVALPSSSGAYATNADGEVVLVGNSAATATWKMIPHEVDTDYSTLAAEELWWTTAGLAVDFTWGEPDK